jgi:type VI secretion system secreted protein VgrG
MALHLPRAAVPPFDVREILLEEEMNRPFRARIVAVSDDPALDLRDLLGEPATITLGAGAVVPEVSGIVRRIRQLASGAPPAGEPAGGSLTRYEIEIVPELALLEERTDHRIFQELGVAEILAEVLAPYGGLVAVPEAGLVEVRPPREYTTQYGETDLAFVSRLLEENGIASFFDHFDASRWTICDTPARYLRPLSEPIPYLEVEEPAGVGLHLFAGAIKETLRAGRATLRAHDADKPEFPLFASQEAPREGLRRVEPALERYGYAAGAFTAATASLGVVRARHALAAHRGRRRGIKVRSTFAIPPGATLTIADHPGAGVDGEWLVVAARTRSGERGSKHKLWLVPADPLEPFRPPLRTKRPRIAGCQTATVWGPPGEEIPVDSRGRVRVRFHWDRAALDPAQAPTRFLRVSQAWAGQAFGVMFLPRTGQEVIVEFLDGDPDEPIVTGRVHNGIQVPPLILPAERTQSVIRTQSTPGGGGFNEIRFEDAAGAERLDLHAQRDSTWITERNANRFVGVDDALKVLGSQKQGIGGSQSVTVGGTHSLAAGRDILLDAGSVISLTAHTVEIKGLDIHIRGQDYVLIISPSFHVDGPETLFTVNTFTIKASEVLIEAPTIQLNP